MRQIFHFIFTYAFILRRVGLCGTDLFLLQRTMDLRGEIRRFPSPVCPTMRQPPASPILSLTPSLVPNKWTEPFYYQEPPPPLDAIKDHT